MVAEAEVVARLGLGPTEPGDRISALLRDRGLPLSAPPEVARRALALLDLDKKRAGSLVKITRLLELGRGEILELELERLRRGLARTFAAD